ncbi:PqqD family protein [Rhodospirillum sp. A1_3_36]|uniref:PqqD family protein n=1 Tax=Rhodospirillum sp. A1_3_36 TaxID=3391666 RepID=UPI0039A5BA15
MHPGRGTYYGLDTVGTSVWECLDQDIQLADLYARLAEEYDADVETIERDVLPLLEQLIEEELIDVRR